MEEVVFCQTTSIDASTNSESKESVTPVYFGVLKYFGHLKTDRLPSEIDAYRADFGGVGLVLLSNHANYLIVTVRGRVLIRNQNGSGFESVTSMESTKSGVYAL